MRNSRGLSIANIILKTSLIFQYSWSRYYIPGEWWWEKYRRFAKPQTSYILQVFKHSQEALTWRQGWQLCVAMFSNNFNYFILAQQLNAYLAYIKVSQKVILKIQLLFHTGIYLLTCMYGVKAVPMQPDFIHIQGRSSL